MHAQVEGRHLSDQTILGIVLLLCAAGSETVSSLLSGAIWNLDRDPRQRALLYGGRVPVDRVVEELARFDAPIQNTMRTVVEDVELLGEAVPAGARLLLIVASANRDERRFDAPAVLDFTREPRRHMGFGYGIHFCLGAPLARLQGRIVFEALVRRRLELHVQGPGERRTKVDVRGFAALPVAIASPARVPAGP